MILEDDVELALALACEELQMTQLVRARGAQRLPQLGHYIGSNKL